jgi:hypothetical protein
MKNNEPPTHGIVHTGFRGIQAFVTRKKSGCNLIVNRFVIPHDTIPSTVGGNLKKQLTTKNNQENEAISNCKIE